ncbi:MAG TPA: FKBP-type peptidyl-prolyl cis-trans isomerase [Gemmatimonadaceae bacterium]|nr:FKBP-type peptidyl-prolyl cis-trans isomerase [Gemmatimonadaceae bacterium]
MFPRLLRAARGLAVALPLLAAACGTSDRPTAPITDVADATFASSLDVDLAASTRLPSGVYIRDLAVGEGDAVASNSAVSAHYTLWLSSGRLMEQSPDDQPLQFTLGRREAIPGFEIGLVGMQPGGRRQIIIPPLLGFGARPYGDIPAFSILVFEVELLEVQ